MPEQTLTTECEHCGARLGLPNSSVLGKTIKCPKCGEKFVAEANGAPAARPASAPSAKRPRPESAAEAAPRKRRPAPTEDDVDPADDEDFDDEPRPKKKKKRRKAAAKERSPLPFIIGGAVLMLCLVIGGIVAVVMSGGNVGISTKTEAPKEFANYYNDLFSLDLPKDKAWKFEAGGETSSRWVTSTSGKVLIKAIANLRGSINSDTMRLNETGNPDLDPVAQIHNDPDAVASFKEAFGDDYKESKDVRFENASFQTRRSDFTAGNVKGIRCTYLGGAGRCFNLRMSCPASEWETLKPVFEKVLMSFRGGRRD